MDIFQPHQNRYLTPRKTYNVSIIFLGNQQTPHDGSGQPEQKEVYKFVIISSGEGLHFIYGPLREYAYHAGLVKKYCELENIPSGWVKKPDVYEIYDSDHKIRGGGWMERNPADKSARLYGHSTAYGAFDHEDIPYLFGPAAMIEDFSIQIDD